MHVPAQKYACLHLFALVVLVDFLKFCIDDVFIGAAIGARRSRFAFRALRPVFDTAAFTVAAAPEGDDAAKTWVVDPEGFLAMDGKVGFG